MTNKNKSSDESKIDFRIESTGTVPEISYKSEYDQEKIGETATNVVKNVFDKVFKK